MQRNCSYGLVTGNKYVTGKCVNVQLKHVISTLSFVSGARSRRHDYHSHSVKVRWDRKI